MPCRVRPAVLGDEVEMGDVHVRAWLAAYRGLLPDEYLDSIRPEQRADFWRQILSDGPANGNSRLVAEADGGTMLGFIVVGPGVEDVGEGEVYAVNVDPDHWGTGVGSQLLEAGIAALTAYGYRTAILWVHPDNWRARGFYESRGWSDDSRARREDVMGVEVPEARYSRVLDKDST